MAKKATGKAQVAAKDNAAERAKAGKGPNPSGAAPEAGTQIVSVNKQALSTDVGPAVVAMLAKAHDDESKALDALANVKSTRYLAISKVVLGVVKAAKADKGINLADAFSGDKKKMQRLNDQLGLALGFREVAVIVDGEKTLQRIVPSKAVASFFPGPDDKKDANGDYATPEARRKDTIRSNFITLVKRAAQSAEGIIVKDLKAEMDKSEGTLRISGAAIKSEFGTDSVLLNENQSQNGKDKQLKAKPSFTAIRDMGAKAHDAAVARGSNTRGVAAAGAAKPVDPDTAFQSMASQIVQVMGKFTGPLAGKTKEAAQMLANALTTKLQQT